MNDGENVKRQARRAGLLYVAVLLSAPVALLYVPSRLIVSGDAAATAEAIRGAAGLVRLGIASELFHQCMVIYLVLALYRLFRPVDEGKAKQLVVLGALVSVPIMFVNVLNELAALALAGGATYLGDFTREQRDGLAYLFMHLHGKGIDLASVFWGLWLFPFGSLVIRSGFIPRFLGVLLMVAGGSYLASAVATLVAPSLRPVVGPVAGALEVAEVPIIIWLAVWGAREADRHERS